MGKFTHYGVQNDGRVRKDSRNVMLSHDLSSSTTQFRRAEEMSCHRNIYVILHIHMFYASSIHYSILLLENLLYTTCSGYAKMYFSAKTKST